MRAVSAVRASPAAGIAGNAAVSGPEAQEVDDLKASFRSMWSKCQSVRCGDCRRLVVVVIKRS